LKKADFGDSGVPFARRVRIISVTTTGLGQWMPSGPIAISG